MKQLINDKNYGIYNVGSNCMSYFDRVKQLCIANNLHYENYKKYLDQKNVFIPKEEKYQFNSYHTFVVQVDKRNQLIEFLLKNGIITAIHYPIPIHLQLLICCVF